MTLLTLRATKWSSAKVTWSPHVYCTGLGLYQRLIAHQATCNSARGLALCQLLAHACCASCWLVICKKDLYGWRLVYIYVWCSFPRGRSLHSQSRQQSSQGRRLYGMISDCRPQPIIWNLRFASATADSFCGDEFELTSEPRSEHFEIQGVTYWLTGRQAIPSCIKRKILDISSVFPMKICRTPV
jgi:hypothetical protein